ncbi:hypothetical protein CR513_38963, partial [Mucuna pruriens]
MAFSYSGGRYIKTFSPSNWTNYFTKWVEVEPIMTITAKRIICRFRLPSIIVSDNDMQFTSQLLANRVILRGLKRRLEEAKGRQGCFSARTLERKEGPAYLEHDEFTYVLYLKHKS